MAPKTFLDQQSKIMKTWILPVDGEMCRVVLEKDTLDIWVNGKKVEVAAEFTDDGTIIMIIMCRNASSRSIRGTL